VGYSGSGSRGCGAALPHHSATKPETQEAENVQLWMDRIRQVRGGCMSHIAHLEPSNVVTAFAAALNRRDIDAARALMAVPTEMIFPGSTVFHDVGYFFEWTKTRYRRATYNYDRLDTVDGGENTVVYANGTIAGEKSNRETFSDIRVIDRFEIQNGRIARKEAWSDMADFLRRKGK
jgi:limonene-1,2-epoxide hydrolase